MKKIALALLVAVALCAPALAAMQDEGVRVANPERVKDRLRFTVVTPGGPLLDVSDFRIKINTLEAEGVVARSVEAAQRSSGAVLVVDTSGSMKGKPIQEARDAIQLFANTVERETGIALVGFADSETVESGFTTDKQAIIDAGKGLVARGETAVYDGLLTAIELAGERKEEQRNVVLLSDGADTSSSASLGDVQAAALASNVRVYVVGLKSPDFDPRSLKGLADATNGELLVTSTPELLSTLFADIARTLVRRYTVEVVNPDPLASEVEIHVQVVHADGSVSGSATFDIGAATFTEPGKGLSIESVPPTAAAALIAISLALFSAVGFQILRARRSSPGDRLSWYVEETQDPNQREGILASSVLQRAQVVATQIAARTGYLERLETDLDAAGIKWHAGEVLVASAGIGMVAGFVGWALVGTIGAFLFGLLGLFGPTMYVKITVSRRRAAFSEQLSDVLLLMSGALKAGHSIQQAMTAVARDAKPPAADEFRRAMAEVRLGATLDDALDAMAKRVGLVDFDWTILAIQIQREVGGNLSEILEIISETIRERDKLRRDIKALTAEGRMSAWVLGILPIAMGGFLFMNSPDYLEPLYTTSAGLKAIGVSVTMMVLGVFWMRKIIRIEV
jgi:tight adherence protein B